MLHHVLSRIKNRSLARATLLSIALVDEVVAGVFTVGLPLVRDQLGLSYTQIGLLFSVGSLIAILLEPPINLLSDQRSKRAWILGGLFTLTLGFLLAGSAQNFAMLLIAFALISPANGAAVGLAQAALIDQQPQESIRTMTRWTLMSSIGDLLAPLTVSLIVSMQQGWSMLCWLAAAIWLGLAIVLSLLRFPQVTPSIEDTTLSIAGIIPDLRAAIGDPVLVRWAVLTLIPSMVDEIFLGFVALYLRDILHANSASIGLILGITMLGGLAGLFMLDRISWLQRITPRHLLSLLALLVLLGFVGLFSTHSLVFAALALFIISLGAAGWYPIAKAQAYTRFPGRSGMVRAVISLGAPFFDVALPGIIGLVAGRFGLTVALAILGTAPILVLLLLLKRRGNSLIDKHR